MSNQTYVKLTGWVAKDPEMRVTNRDQTPVCTVRVGTASRWLDRSTGEWKEGPASYFDVVCWRSLAVNASASLRKGHRVTVNGTFRTKNWTDRDNNTRTEVEITATSIGHDLLFGWTHFNRLRPGTSDEERLATGEASRSLAPGTEFGPSANYGPEAGYGEADGDPVRPAGEPDDGQVYGTGDEGGADQAGISETTADDPRREDVAVPF